MRLILLRHGDAGDAAAFSGDDRERPLSEQGRTLSRQILERLGVALSVQRIFTSPWLRARQTAEIAGAALDRAIEDAPWLAGDFGNAGRRCTELAAHARDLDALMIVGHEPGLGELIGLLCAAEPIALKKNGIAILDGRPRAGGMELHALLPPKLVLAIRG